MKDFKNIFLKVLAEITYVCICLETMYNSKSSSRQSLHSWMLIHYIMGDFTKKASYLLKK